ncbi:bfd9d5a9-58d4-4a48-80d0-dcb302a45a12 [Sclerotinia trifoliorum]|uniref:Bfd9d5a9-58d4-4a48-80d0-dcb302a45a12 n=1 Tax=Sclerotinia trifoliorum TaxID=28548 RepID=A0A8H2VSM7_9HELO|nr:bfd9d5a9-58d4-4a48-80d0-dcb302a45a12 [Sclerotinia trifoliorum]
MMSVAPMLLYYRYPADLAVPYQRYSSAAYPSVSLYDSDNEPLLPRSNRLSALSTAPYPSHTYSQHMYAAPSFHNAPVSEDSIIPAIVIDVIPAERRYSSGSDTSQNDTIRPRSKTGLVSRLVKKKKDKAKNAGDEKEKRLTKVIYMPRREYLKHFARGQSGEYIGTEPHRRWTEEELEQTFGRFRPPAKRNSGMFWTRG